MQTETRHISADYKLKFRKLLAVYIDIYRYIYIYIYIYTCVIGKYAEGASFVVDRRDARDCLGVAVGR